MEGGYIYIYTYIYMCVCVYATTSVNEVTDCQCERGMGWGMWRIVCCGYAWWPITQPVLGILQTAYAALMDNRCGRVYGKTH